jgi:hypothetical protein
MSVEDLDEPPTVGVAELHGHVRRPQTALQQESRASVAELVQIDVAPALGAPRRGDRTPQVVEGTLA